MSCAHEERRDALLQRVFAGEGDRAEENELLALADRCEQCGAAYDRMNELERRLEGGEILSQAAASRVFDRVMAQTAGEATSPRTSADVVPLRRRTQWVPLALAAGLAAVAAPALLMTRSAQRDEYTARGGAAELPSFSARLFCVPPAPSAPIELADGEACARDAELAFAASNRGTTALLLTVRSGSDSHGSPHSLSPGASDEALPSSIPLADRAGETVKVSVCASDDCRDFEVRVR